MKKIKLIIADDHTMFLEGIVSLLEIEEHITIIGKAINGNEVQDLLKKSLTDIVLLDISMPEMDGIEVTKLIKNTYPSVKVLIISTHSNVQMIAKLIRMNVDGYLLKNAEKEELLLAINTIQNGGRYFCEEVNRKNEDNTYKLKNEILQITELSNREKEILILIAQEFTGNEIADKVNLSLNTINTHRRNLLSKINVKNTAGLVKYAIEYGLLD
ncbi:DNA-binding NarL/FixJ family response regulator [Flavobacterium sp. 7E]|uniref:response regulator transcription factor n=1 Tax=Flavobacterium sp. 7E TaxID=2735898 RepID=UPI00156F97F1|nr:response regulator transcription factor [Flavobacterium sp. 7E]NRS89198.1 DNA-binding NarL/FixJ family response regulator [Flavobacterium sp. 7E]